MLFRFSNKRNLFFYTILTAIILSPIILHILTRIVLAPVRADLSEIQTSNRLEPIEIDSNGIKLKAWRLVSRSEKGIILLLHGIRANKSSMLPRAEFLANAGYSSILLDFQAHGESEGDLITLGIKESENVRDTIRFIKKNYPNKPIGILGTSLGGASALLADISENLDFLILEAVYSRIEDAIRNRLNNRLFKPLGLFTPIVLVWLQFELDLSKTGLRPIDHLQNLKCPVFIISGEEDPYTFTTETNEMYEISPNPKKLWLVKGVGHVDLYSYSKKEYENNILNFINIYIQKIRPGIKDNEYKTY
ncbi:alpha/beta hydrolase [Leptospira sarikeiensis]|uniref:Alpha/beta hydrolase n=1 Tax=Leptospira sarikeiensis TaxID=2484943 RepID=A0A4R9K1C0_9LEPT|nr:alpha/beta fold hydrolase [Leptospira sarikeiensis]TGL58906.1 alpha/beta hydrolase [Leptospira sarikeiensis]